MYFSKNHNWIKQDNNNNYYIGITSYNIKSLGDIVYIELPKVGSSFKKDDTFITVESVKTSSELDCPFDCVILESNETTVEKENILKLNKHPQDFWLCKVSSNSFNKSDFLTQDEYQEYVKDLE